MLRGVFCLGGPVTYQFPVGVWHYFIAYVFVHTRWPIHSCFLLLLWSLWMECSAKEMGWAATHYTPYYENYIAAVCNYPNKCLYDRGGSVQATMANYEHYIVLSRLGSWWPFSWWSSVSMWGESDSATKHNLRRSQRRFSSCDASWPRSDFLPSGIGADNLFFSFLFMIHATSLLSKSPHLAYI